MSASQEESLGSSICPICGKDVPHYHPPEVVDAHYFRKVPIEPTGEQWGGLARSIMMWIDMSAGGPKLPEDLLKHLERSGVTAPKWLLDEGEMKAVGHSMSKGSRCVLIYKAMIHDAPDIK
jgi:hypothetical protein